MAGPSATTSDFVRNRLGQIATRTVDYFTSAPLYPRAWAILQRATRTEYISDGLAELRKLSTQNPSADGAKYLWTTAWLHDNAVRAARLKLDREPRLRILDLGAGAGYFLAIARCCGHEACGIDRWPHPIYSPANSAFGNEITYHQIGPSSMKSIGLGQFDLITAFSVMFDRTAAGGMPWTPYEWTTFLRVAGDMLRPNGRFFCQLNTRTFLGYRGSEYRFLPDCAREAGLEVSRTARRMFEFRKPT